MGQPLEKELKKFQEVLPSLLGQHEGKFCLICDSDVVGIFESYPDALAIGYEKCGVKPFLVKKVSATEQISFFTRDICQPCHI